MRACLLRCWVLFLVVLAGCDGLLEDYSGTLCNPDGGCIEGYHCVAETGRCELGTVDAGVCASVSTCVSNDGCCPEGCYANSDNDCAPVCGNLELEPGEACDDGNTANEDDCPSTCKTNTCGDDFIDRQGPRVEACDDGNTVSETACAYGVRSCAGCASTCTEVLALEGPYCGDGTQNGPEACDDGNGSNEDNCLTTCVRATCGDGYRHMTNEECDDGNRVSETACPYGTPSCTQCNAACTALLSLTGAYCGDAFVSDGEACDDGNTLNETECPYGTASCTACNATCDAKLNLTGPHCGNGTISHGEVCDDGNTLDETSCPYGSGSCTTCNATCSAMLNLTGPFCGDGIASHGETCDDGNTVTETSCPYGQATCTRCDAACMSTLSLTGPFCGDGSTHPSEVCDDGNTDACGTCSLTCSKNQLAKATGTITTIIGKNLHDGDRFTITDGINGTTVTFEFDRYASGVSGSNIQIAFADSDMAEQIANYVASAINTKVPVPFEITATASSNMVSLTHQREGSYANRALTEAVYGDANFRVNGMSGGGGYDCSQGTRCKSNADCEPSLVCQPAGTCGVP